MFHVDRCSKNPNNFMKLRIIFVCKEKLNGFFQQFFSNTCIVVLSPMAIDGNSWGEKLLNKSLFLFSLQIKIILVAS